MEKERYAVKKEGKKPEKKPKIPETEKPEAKPEEGPKAVPKIVPETPAPPPITPKPEAMPVMSDHAKITYNYLKKHGAASPLQISKALNLDTLIVVKALKELRNLGKVTLSG